MWAQAGEKIDGFVCSSGTGGTIGGCSRFLKERNPDCKVYWCAQPPFFAPRCGCLTLEGSGESVGSESRLEGCGCVARSIDPPGSGLHGLLEQGPEAAITPGASPSSPDGMTPFDGDRKPPQTSQR